MLRKRAQKMHFVLLSLTWTFVLPVSVLYMSVKLTCIDGDVSGRDEGSVYSVKHPSSYWHCTRSCQADDTCMGMDLCQFANGSRECRLHNTSAIPVCLEEAEVKATCQHIAIVSITLGTNQDIMLAYRYRKYYSGYKPTRHVSISLS
jgi:hypothetical protein